MAEERMLYLVGEADFENLRREGAVYVDKTELVHQLVTGGKYYFLSRPRRFGKSLLVSTLAAYFEGRQDLFKGLALERLVTQWVKHPVLRLDFGVDNYTDLAQLDATLNTTLLAWEAQYGKGEGENTYAARFRGVIARAHESTQQQVVVLIDEYDSPVLDALSDDALQEANRKLLRSFYSALKSSTRHLRFVFITGITRFARMSIFSGLNNLMDISLAPAYASLCGITGSELRRDLAVGVERLARQNGHSLEATYEALETRYDGYRFSPDAPEGVYNPFSLLMALAIGKLKDFWFDTGTPEFLYKAIVQQQFMLEKFEECTMPERALMDWNLRSVKLVPLLLQTGYLTIDRYNEPARMYYLRCPNQEVRVAFYDGLSQYFFLADGDGEYSIPKMLEAMAAGDMEELFRRLYAFLAGCSYEITGDAREFHFQFAMTLIFRGMGLQTQAEHRTSDGRIDATVETARYVYIFELKLDQPAEAAMQQIEEKHYAAPYAADPRAVVRIGVRFGSQTRNVEEALIRQDGAPDLALLARNGKMVRA